jgi:hypothetical protein
MAISKIPRGAATGPEDSLLSILRSNRALLDHEQPWMRALTDTGTGEPSLRFPVYEYLYRINVHSHALVDAIQTVSARFSINQEWSVYQQALVQYVRASSTRNILTAMTDIEQTEALLFRSQRELEEKTFTDPDDIYFRVQEREAERKRQGLPPRVRFLNEPQTRTRRPASRKDS